MTKSNYLFTSESVSEGHPDKVCDQISDSILDALLEQDPQSRVACETLATTGLILVTGEITSKGTIDTERIVRDRLKAIGYNNPEYGIDADTCEVMVKLDQQSPDIAMGVNPGGAGDQGMMFGYAVNETPELMPLPIMLSQKLMLDLAQKRHSGEFPFVRPDSKSQVSVQYENGKPKRIPAVVISTQHSPDISLEDLKKEIIEKVIKQVIPAEYLDEQTKYFVNPTGRFVVGGPQGDCGLTGRKIIVDTYGGMGRHGGGAFSGKDPTKVDRSAAYMARYIAKNIVSAGAADRVEVQLAYAIGVAEPVSVLVDTFGTAQCDEAKIEAIVRDTFDLKPKSIIEGLNLRRPIFVKTAAYGHFGRELPDFTWEQTDKADVLRSALGL